MKRRGSAAAIGAYRYCLVIALGVLGVHSAQALEHGSTKARGISAAVEILRDPHGVPHIYANTEADAYFALGYVHAEDRLWQMELNRRAGSGTLSAIFGESLLSEDRLVRTVGIRRAAEQAFPHLDARTRALLTAYSGGVNAYLNQNRLLPLEFHWFGCAPAPWSPADSLTWLRMMAWGLSGNWWEELLNLRLSQRLTPGQLAELLPPYPGEPPHPWPAIQSLYSEMRPLRAAAALPTGLRRAIALGSNNWVIAGNRTASGKPLLANDPHTKISAPALWYLAHLNAPGLNVIGATLPGIPGVFLGRNEHVAWAFTNTGSDTQDLYLEKLSAADAGRYQTPEGTAAFEVIRESIAVKGGREEPLTVRLTRHGPVISDVVPEAAAAPETVLALSWVGLRPDDLTLQFFTHAATARNGAELYQAARHLHTPQQNVVYADAGGAIGFVAAGRVPIRRKDNVVDGLVPAPGWDARYDWQGLIPFESLPHQADPASGAIVTANQKIAPPDYPYLLASSWMPPYRAERIAALLDRKSRHSVESFAAIQGDVVNPVARQLLPHLLQVEPVDAAERALIGRLRAWDAAMTRDSFEALIFASWIRHLDRMLLEEKLGELYDALGDYNPQFLFDVLRTQGGASEWCGRPTADDPKPCGRLIAAALRAAVAQLESELGRDRSRWSWGRVHITRMSSLSADALGPLSGLFGLRTSIPGGMDTVNVSGYYYDDDSGEYVGDTGASLRAIYDLGHPEQSVFVINSGQSGNRFSSHYGDMVKPWANGGYVPMTMDRDRIRERARSRLLLTPA